MKGRIYNEEQIAKILKRAAELEAERSVAGDGSLKQGLTLDELTSIAAESGIDPELLNRAANEFETDSDPASNDFQTEITTKEISCERWINASPDDRVLDELVLELNHHFNTSDQDVTWWDKLWDDYSGKAKVRKTRSSLEWVYKGEHAEYTHRVLFQRRGERFRIRVSKKVSWGYEWHDKNNINLVAIPALLVLVIGGAFLGNMSLGDALIGSIIGAAAFGLLYPASIRFYNHYRAKHKKMVVDLTEKLTDHTYQLIRESGKKRSKEEPEKTIDIIEVDNGSEKGSSQNPAIQNHLRSGSK